RVTAAVFALSMMVVMAGCSSSAGTASAGSSGSQEPGTLVTSRPLTNSAALPSAATNTLINYVSENGRGESIVVSGTVSVPKGPAPEGGWPVISWAHGTTGYADVCAPTLGVGGMAADDYLKEMNHFVDTWVAKGYVVVRTNYEGLGAAGG